VTVWFKCIFAIWDRYNYRYKYRYKYRYIVVCSVSLHCYPYLNPNSKLNPIEFKILIQGVTPFKKRWFDQWLLLALT